MAWTLSREMQAIRTFSGVADSATVLRTSRVSSSVNKEGSPLGPRTMSPAAGVRQYRSTLAASLRGLSRPSGWNGVVSGM